MLSAQEFRKLASKKPVYAVLGNEHGEYTTSEPVHTMVTTHRGTRAVWQFKTDTTPVYPYKFASLIDENGNTLSLFSISTFDGNVLEVTFE